jgi:hypothetical protein
MLPCPSAVQSRRPDRRRPDRPRPDRPRPERLVRPRFSTVAAAVALAIAGLPLAACEKQPSLEEALKTLSGTAETVSGLLEDLNGEKIGKLADLVVELDKHPEKRQELLKEHGIDSKELERALKRIQDDPELRKIFEAAKRVAEQ